MKGILLSGGLDSVALAHLLKPEIAFTVNYGQNSANAEISAAKSICKKIDIEHKVINVDLKEIGSGDLTTNKHSSIAPKSDWYPFRNQLLISIVASYTISNNLDINELIFGTLKTDGYHADGKKEFFLSINKLLELQEGKLFISTPAIEMTSVELIKYSNIDLNLLGWSHSCHKSNFECGNCRGCYKKQSVYADLGLLL